jgi:hypothetical protein
MGKRLQKLLKFEFEDFTLGLLRSLLSFTLQLFDSSCHRLDGLIFFCDPQPCGLVRFLSGLCMDLVDRRLDALLDG